LLHIRQKFNANRVCRIPRMTTASIKNCKKYVGHFRSKRSCDVISLYSISFYV